MYSLDTKLAVVSGVGPKTVAAFQKQDIQTCRDLLLKLPLRYVNRSEIVSIAELSDAQPQSFIATLEKPSSFYKNRRKITSVVAKDETGKVKLTWFNNSFIDKSLKQGCSYMISGTLGKYSTIIHPTLELLKEDSDIHNLVHTGRLVPMYSSTLDLQQGKLRRILHAITGALQSTQGGHEALLQMPISTALQELHFPSSEDAIVVARERVALEELLSLIKTSEQIRKHWKSLQSAVPISVHAKLVPDTIPFQLTAAQQRCVQEIMADMSERTPMNRMLIGDVGSGKTVVAGVAAYHTILSGKSAILVAPTKILAEQHYKTLTALFPQIPISFITGKTSKAERKILEDASPKLVVGTHAVIGSMAQLQAGLVIYDEQHRFGVAQRSKHAATQNTTHSLSMSATPIPRSLMLTIFSHLSMSMIDELPKGRIPTKTWVLGDAKREDSYTWIEKELSADDETLALIVCPFIDPSEHEAFEGIASAKETFALITQRFPTQTVGLLHGQMKPKQQEEIIAQLYAKQVRILVTTPIVEVGVDLPTATIMVIEAAQRFGMSSLHQLRGRVGRAGQQGYCILFHNAQSKNTQERLANFSRENNGLKLAELDLQSRGSGDIFGTQQSGFSGLQFASWTNAELIGQAKKIYEQLSQQERHFLFDTDGSSGHVPLAN